MSAWNGVSGTVLGADVLKPRLVSRDNVADCRFKIDSRDKENPIYYVDGREVPKVEFLRIIGMRDWDSDKKEGK
jgi:hypothetical protein